MGSVPSLAIFCHRHQPPPTTTNQQPATTAKERQRHHSQCYLFRLSLMYAWMLLGSSCCLHGRQRCVILSCLMPSYKNPNPKPCWPDLNLNLTCTWTWHWYTTLVHWGPKSHIIASFTLIAIQWIDTYIPDIYQSMAAILLKLHIYNPQILYERGQQRQWMKHGPPPKKKGLTSTLFGTSKKQGSSSSIATAKINTTKMHGLRGGNQSQTTLQNHDDWKLRHVNVQG